MINPELTFDAKLFVFETVLRVRNAEIDSGQYLTLESLTALLAEARALFLYSKGIEEVDIDSQGLMINDLQLHIFSRVNVREELFFELGVTEISDDGGDIVIKVTRMANSSLVATARQHFINYDYRLNKVISLSNPVKRALTSQLF
jgi:acyl-CoA thioesterase FadM